MPGARLSVVLMTRSLWRHRPHRKDAKNAERNDRFSLRALRLCGDSFCGPPSSSRSHEVIEILLVLDSPSQHEQMRRQRMGIEPHIVARTVPEIAGAGQEIVHLVLVLAL